MTSQSVICHFAVPHSCRKANRKCTGQIEGAGTESAHYADGGGHAVDFYMLDGHELTGSDGESIRLLSLLDAVMPAGSGAGEVQCRNDAGDPITLVNFTQFSDTRNHQHIDVLGAKGGLRGSRH